MSKKRISNARTDRLIYIVTLPIKKPGAYQLRMAVRDSTTRARRSANQFIEVPDIQEETADAVRIILSASRAQAAGTRTFRQGRKIMRSPARRFANSSIARP